MKVIVVADYEELSREAARFIGQQVLLKEDSVLGLPTGETPIGLYEKLVQIYNQYLLDLSKVVTFNLDEYYGLPQDHPQSYHRYMREKFFRYVNIREENIHIPDGLARDPEEECKRYEEEIAHHGGIDLLVLGIGPNGHIGFNEPGSDWGTRTRLADLSEETRRREARRFGGLDLVPTRAITMGIKTIMNARKILLLASGEEKAEVVRRVLVGPIIKEVPASILQLHPDATMILDAAAISKIRELQERGGGLSRSASIPGVGLFFSTNFFRPIFSTNLASAGYLNSQAMTTQVFHEVKLTS
jgi:glucosamine-6-phosphate deaminase